VGFRAGLDTEARGRILCLCRGSNPFRPVCGQTRVVTLNTFKWYDTVFVSCAELSLQAPTGEGGGDGTGFVRNSSRITPVVASLTGDVNALYP
jgi:hypothetical protein